MVNRAPTEADAQKIDTAARKIRVLMEQEFPDSDPNVEINVVLSLSWFMGNFIRDSSKPHELQKLMDAYVSEARNRKPRIN